MPGTERLVGQPESVGQLTDMLRQDGYLADRGLATALYVAMSLQRPILLEGEVGVGKRCPSTRRWETRRSTSCSAPSSCWSARCWRRSGPATGRCC